MQGGPSPRAAASTVGGPTACQGLAVLGQTEVAQASHARVEVVTSRRYTERTMSYNLTLRCGCLVYIACDPLTSVAHARIIERRDPGCRVRKHEVGLRLSLGEIVTELEEIQPEPEHQPVPRAGAVRKIVTQAGSGPRRHAR